MPDRLHSSYSAGDRSRVHLYLYRFMTSVYHAVLLYFIDVHI